MRRCIGGMDNKVAAANVFVLADTSYRDIDELDAELVGRLKATAELSLVYNLQQLLAGCNQFENR